MRGLRLLMESGSANFLRTFLGITTQTKAVIRENTLRS